MFIYNKLRRWDKISPWVFFTLVTFLNVAFFVLNSMEEDGPDQSKNFLYTCYGLLIVKEIVLTTGLVRIWFLMRENMGFASGKKKEYMYSSSSQRRRYSKIAIFLFLSLLAWQSCSIVDYYYINKRIDPSDGFLLHLIIFILSIIVATTLLALMKQQEKSIPAALERAKKARIPTMIFSDRTSSEIFTSSDSSSAVLLQKTEDDEITS
eukprot:TRINITY_DN3767_c0_g1_i2.p1 TRINITY_DN3767_c0_g1~~TRINITY_DN3767_c0_g1_i2.p1  ORF type:complete len:208 (+),score=27.00 TRINITY_DN3767_c0_g1_i2:424-1047(+)